MEEQNIITDYIKLNEMQLEIDNINKEIEEKMNEWEMLNEKLNIITV